MSITESARQYHERMFPGYRSKFLETDPEFIERFDNFAFDEVVHSGDLDDRTRMMAILAALIGCQGIDEFRAMLPAALNFGVTSVEAKEIVYQAVAYLEIGRVFPFLHAVNDVLTARGVALPLEGQATTTMETHLAAGEQAQIDIFGEGMRGFSQSGPEGTRHIRRWLSANCFGDYYTRKGLGIPGARDDHILLPRRAGRVRAAARLPCRGKHADRERRGIFDSSGLPVRALSWLSPQLERLALCGGGCKVSGGECELELKHPEQKRPAAEPCGRTFCMPFPHRSRRQDFVGERER